MFALAAVALFGLTGAANAATAMLASDDFVGISFWVIAMGMAAATVFFFMERNTVAAGWKTSVTVAGLVTGVAFIHYMYMRDVWVMTGDSPTVYRYIDWLITNISIYCWRISSHYPYISHVHVVNECNTSYKTSYCY